MNAPEFLGAASPLPPLSPHAQAGSAPRVSIPQSIRSAWTGGFADIAGDSAEPFCFPCDPTPIADCQWLAVSPGAAQLIGQDAAALVQSPEWLAVLSGGAVVDHMQPYAGVYAGHQFGVFVPRLGDGRALNLGAINGWELQLKGAGPTPYARFADGRAVLRSSIREFLCSEAMHSLGIPSTRALSLIISPSAVLRETVETAAVVCRLAPSFVRFGTFEYFSSRGRTDLLEVLVRHVAQWIATGAKPPRNEGPESVAVQTLDLLHEVARRTARLMAQWMGAGFMHGVMNTDNFSILGLTLDYGPFGFMDGFDAGHICNHSDHHGRYSYQAQPQVGMWNLGRLINALYPLVRDADRLREVLETYKACYAQEIDAILRAKLGLQALPQEEWSPLLDDFYTLLQRQHMDYTLSFRALSNGSEQAFIDLAPDREACRSWLARYGQAAKHSASLQQISGEERLTRMRRVNPKYVLRNWVAEEVIRAVRDHGDSRPFEEVLKLLQAPFDEHPGYELYAAPPPDWAEHLAVSCSS
ncbi:MAG: YdiU family protein [Burkholderiaceae bacterium]|nr:YdiU family protein [Burkholderiaceae bacterium]